MICLSCARKAMQGKRTKCDHVGAGRTYPRLDRRPEKYEKLIDVSRFDDILDRRLFKRLKIERTTRKMTTINPPKESKRLPSYMKFFQYRRPQKRICE